MPCDAVRALWKDRLLPRVDLAPLDRATTRSLLAARLGGDVAATAVEHLWQHSGGNPLYLTELIRFGLDTGRLRCDAGVWWWRGGREVPPRLDELLGHRLDGLTPAAREALDVLALSEPLPYDTVAAVAAAEALAELDEHGLTVWEDGDGVVRLRIAHPLLRAVARHRLNPARRRRLAERLRGAPAHGAQVRALTVRLAALALGDRPNDALRTGAELLAALDRRPVAPNRAGLAHAMLALAHLYCAPGAHLPRAFGMSGRWPANPAGASAGQQAPAWPLLEGLRRHLEGDRPLAEVAMREAYVQQSAGEGLLRSEAVAGLIVVLAEAGKVDEAAALLDTAPPDDVAALPALPTWAAYAVAAAGGQTGIAAKLALEASRQAVAAGAVTLAVGHLADAARLGAADAALAEIRSLAEPARSDLTRARVAAITARAAGDADALLDAADQHLTLSLFGPAADLANQASARAGTGRAATVRTTRAAAIVRRSGSGLGIVQLVDPGPGSLTPRELEIARMAAGGLSDREIAAGLVVSVRTVESHLRSVYRKLEIRSRRGLGGALAAVAS